MVFLGDEEGPLASRLFSPLPKEQGLPLFPIPNLKVSQLSLKGLCE